MRLLSHLDAEVRAAACELIALRHEVAWRESVAELALRDTSLFVRDACARASEHLESYRALAPTAAPSASPSPSATGGGTLPPPPL